MLLNEFCQGYFRPVTEEQVKLLERFLKLREKEGFPARMRVLRSLARTRPYTRTVIPPGWRLI